MIHRRILLAFISSLTCVALVLAGGEVRTWSDATGKFKIEAKFVAQDKGKVTLEKTDGKRFDIDATKLSQADQKFLAELGKKKPDDPFKAVEGPAKEIKVSWVGVRKVDVVPPAGGWKVTAKPAAEVKLKPVTIELPATKGFGHSSNGLVFSEASRRALVGYQYNLPAQPKQGNVLLCDLDEGKISNNINVGGGRIPFALSDDGNQAILVGDQFRVELWSLAGKGEKLLEFIPYGDVTGNPRIVQSAFLLDAKRLLTVSWGGKVALWDLTSGKAVYQMEVQLASHPALSPDRKLLAFTTATQVGLLDVDAGKVIALQAAPGSTMFAVMGFSPDGQSLACSANFRMAVWNVANGVVQRDISTKAFFGGTHMVWTSNKHILLGGTALFDVDMQFSIWQYQGQEFAKHAGGLTWFVTHNGPGRQGALTAASLPHLDAQKALEKAIADPSVIVLKKGTVVKLNVSSLPDPAERAKAAKALEAQLAKNGCTVGANGTIELVATTELGTVRDLHFRVVDSFEKFNKKSPPPGGTIRVVKFQEHGTRVKFMVEGKMIWEAPGTNLPGNVQLAAGETLEGHLKKRERPNYDFFRTIDLPPLLLRSTGAAGLGSTTVTPAGVR